MLELLTIIVSIAIITHVEGFAFLWCMMFGVVVTGIILFIELRRIRDEIHKPAPTLYVDDAGVCHWKCC